MRRIAVIGAGQAGLTLAFGLLDHGYQVTVVSNRTPEQIRAGKVMSSQIMFRSALDIERDLRINHWEQECPNVNGIGLTITQKDAAMRNMVEWGARLHSPAQSVDQRIKMAGWLEQIETRGGQLLFQDVGLDDLETLTASHDLVVLAAGKGDIVRLFERDALRSPFDKPQRALALTYVHGLEKNDDSFLEINIIPGVGEYFLIPALTHSGECDIMIFEGLPGGPLDCWHGANTASDHLARSMRFLHEYLPEQAHRARHAVLTDEHGFLSGAFAPTVRKPVLTLPSGRLVFGLGDTVVTNDPITGQGANNAAKAAKIYLDAILAQGKAPFAREWMEKTFGRFWHYAQWVVHWTNSLLLPPEPHILELFGAAMQLPSLASEIANGFDHPPCFFPWWNDEYACRRIIAEHNIRSVA